MGFIFNIIKQAPNQPFDCHKAKDILDKATIDSNNRNGKLVKFFSFHRQGSKALSTLAGYGALIKRIISQF